MKLYQWFRGSLVALSTFGVLVPHAGQVVAAQQEAAQQAHLSDVALGDGGVLRGQVVDAQGVPQSGVDVALQTRGNEVARVVTDQDGHFEVSRLRGGAYEITAGDQVVGCRVWAANTAPPSALPALLVVTGNTARGQSGIVRRYGPGALVVLGGIGAVIAISATNDNDEGS